MTDHLRDAPLSRCCTFLTGGRAARLVYAYSQNELCESAARGALVLGRGSNVLIGDAGYCGEVVVNRSDARSFTDEYCECESGMLLSLVSREYMRLGRTGLEWAYGLPGSVGGAAVGNAGAFGKCFADCVQTVTVLQGGHVRTISADECGFTYRGSKIEGTVLSAVLKAPKGNVEDIRSECERVLRIRRQTQPIGASAGSVFKAAGPVAAGLLCDMAGLKGKTAGGAEISTKHANFIMNRGGSTSADIITLMRLAEAEVFDRYGIILRREIKLIGDFF